MRDVAVIGVGMTPFGKFIDTPIKELGRRAVWDALQDARISPREIQTAYCGNACLGMITGQSMVLGQIILKETGIGGIPITNVENACASGSSAFREAWISVASGMCDVALALGAEKLYAGDPRLSTKALAGATEVEYEANLGLTMPGHWALRAKRYMEKYGITRRQLALPSVKNHRNGCRNPRAQYKKECTVEEVLASRTIADPLTLLSCGPMGDGAAAAILCSRDVAAKYTTRPVWVAASALTSGTYSLKREVARNQVEEHCGRLAFEMAGIGPEDLDLTKCTIASPLPSTCALKASASCRRANTPTGWSKAGRISAASFPSTPAAACLPRGTLLGPPAWPRWRKLSGICGVKPGTGRSRARKRAWPTVPAAASPVTRRAARSTFSRCSHTRAGETG